MQIPETAHAVAIGSCDLAFYFQSTGKRLSVQSRGFYDFQFVSCTEKLASIMATLPKSALTSRELSKICYQQATTVLAATKKLLS